MVEPVLRGRSAEIARLGTLLAGATVDGRGSTVLLSGEPGIGKSALLRVLQSEAVAAQFAVGFGKADEVSQIAPGAPVLHALRTGSNPVLTEAEFHGLAALYDRPLWLVEAVGDLLEQRSQRSPVLMVIDDLQWADRLSRFALRTLAGRLADSAVVWSVAARGRPAEVFADFHAAGQFEGTSIEHIDLQPLTDGDVIAVATDILGAPPVGNDRSWLRMVGGNPFLTIQLAEGIALERKLGRIDTALPEALSSTIRSRTRLLGSTANRALQLAAVWGRPLDITDAAEILDIDPALLAASLSHAGELGLINDPNDAIEFRHDLVREIVYNNLPETDRTRLHGVCARYLVSIGRSAVDAVAHARPAALRGDPSAVTILRRAALECIDSVPRTAAALIVEAFSCVSPEDPEWLALGGQCAELLIEAQHGVDAIDVIDRLLRRADLAEQRARLQILAARALWLTGSADHLASRVESELRNPAMTEALHARLEALRSLALSRIGTGHEASVAAESALNRGRAIHDRATEQIALQALGEVAKNEGRHVRAHDLFHGLRVTFGPGFLADEITSLQFIDRFDDAQVLLSLVARGQGQHSTAELPSLLRAQLWQDFKLAHFDAAVVAAETLLDVGDELGNFVHRLDARVVMSTIAIVHGDLDLARTIVAVAEDELGAWDAVHAPGLILARARIAAAESDFDEGVRLLKPLLANDSTSRTYWPRLLDQMRLSAGIAISAGDLGFARETVERADSAARRNPGVLSFRGVALQVRGFVHDDLGSLEHAVELLGQSPRPVILATALTDHAGLLLRHGNRERAAKQLTQAWEIYDGLRAGPALAHVQALLAEAQAGLTTGRRRVTRPVSGWGSLTDTELLVARLIVQGHTNRSAADRLGISTNTVGAHLRAVFMKMDVHSRVQLVNALPEGTIDGPKSGAFMAASRPTRG